MINSNENIVNIKTRIVKLTNELNYLILCDFINDIEKLTLNDFGKALSTHPCTKIKYVTWILVLPPLIRSNNPIKRIRISGGSVSDYLINKDTPFYLKDLKKKFRKKIIEKFKLNLVVQ